MQQNNMTDLNPYLLRAYYDWMVANRLTPYLLVDAVHPGVEVPEECISDGKIVLDISGRAVAYLAMDLTVVSFNACFSGRARQIVIPTGAIMAIYAHENGAGIDLTTNSENSRVPSAVVGGCSKMAGLSLKDGDLSGDRPAGEKKRPKPQLKIVE